MLIVGGLQICQSSHGVIMASAKLFLLFMGDISRFPVVCCRRVEPFCAAASFVTSRRICRRRCLLITPAQLEGLLHLMRPLTPLHSRSNLHSRVITRVDTWRNMVLEISVGLINVVYVDVLSPKTWLPQSSSLFGCSADNFYFWKISTDTNLLIWGLRQFFLLNSALDYLKFSSVMFLLEGI